MSDFDTAPVDASADLPASPETESPVANKSVDTDPVAAAENVVANPTATKTEKQEAKRSLEKFKLKVYGREYEEEVDLGNRDELTKRFQKAAAADRTMSEAAEVRKAAMSFIEELKKNPRRVLSDPSIGVDVRKFAEDILNEQIQEMEKSPEQREREQLQRELEDIKRQREDEKKSFERREFERLQVEHERNLETDISAALDIGGLPKTPRTVKAMAEMMMIALEHGIDLSARDIAPIVKNTTLSEFKEVVNSLADDQLEDFLGKEVIGRLRKRNVAKAKAIETASAVKSTGNDMKKAKVEEPVKKMTIRDFLNV